MHAVIVHREREHGVIKVMALIDRTLRRCHHLQLRPVLCRRDIYLRGIVGHVSGRLGLLPAGGLFGVTRLRGVGHGLVGRAVGDDRRLFTPLGASEKGIHRHGKHSDSHNCQGDINRTPDERSFLTVIHGDSSFQNFIWICHHYFCRRRGFYSCGGYISSFGKTCPGVPVYCFREIRTSGVTILSTAEWLREAEISGTMIL